MLKRISLVFLVALLCFTAGCGSQRVSAPLTWQEQHDLGVRYLSEGNYEEAIIAFTAAIEIDAKRPENYAGLAEAYLAAGDIDNAIAALEKGFAVTGDLGLKDQLARLMEEDAVPAGDLFTGPYLTLEEVELLHLTLEEAASLVEADGVYDPVEYGRITEGDQWRFSDFGTGGNETGGEYNVLTLYQSYSAATVSEIQFSGWREEGLDLSIDVHARNICLGDGWEEVLEAIGFSEEERKIIGGPQDISVTRETGEESVAWMVGFSGEASVDGFGQIVFSYRDGDSGESQLIMDFYGGCLNSFLVFTGIQY